MGGGEREMCELANELAQRGHDVQFYALPYLMGTKPKVDPHRVLKGVTYQEGWSHDIKADIAYTFYHPFSSMNFRVKGRRIASFHSQAFFMRSVPPSYGLVPMVASYGTKLVGPLELRLYDAIHTHYPQPNIRHKKTYIIPGWVDTKVFKPGAQKYEEFTVLFSGRAVWQKGWDIYVKLAEKMKGLGVRFLYVGGTVRDAVIKSLGFQWNPVALSEIYNRSHVLINPSRAETFGRVSIESMACGTPVVTNPSPAHTSLKLPFVIGNSIQDYEESILDLKSRWEQGNPYARLSDECSHAAQAYSFQNTVSAYEDMFRQIIGGV